MTTGKGNDPKQQQQSIPVEDDDFEFPSQPCEEPFITSSTWYHNDPDEAKRYAFLNTKRAAEDVCTNDECNDVDFIEYVEIDISETSEGNEASFVATVKIRWKCVGVA